MKKIIAFVKNETVLVIAGILTIVSAFFVPPSAEYLGYIDFSVLSLLFCLMAAVAGMRESGVLDFVCQKLTSKTKNRRILAFILVSLCFFGAMLITNDVALIAFVPLTILLLSDDKPSLIMIIVLETAAANLGSMLTPIGNPQNLYIFSHYNVPVGEFIMITLPLWIIGYFLCVIGILTVKSGSVSDFAAESVSVDKKKALFFVLIFLICVPAIFRVYSGVVSLIACAALILIFYRKTLLKVDYLLLLTFVFFFIFSGNISAIPEVRSVAEKIVSDNELLCTLLLSQTVSNVPATVMLAPFTDDYASLLKGADIGGLGTLIASLASVISFKFYAKTEGARIGRYILIFTGTNIAFMIIMLIFNSFFDKIL